MFDEKSRYADLPNRMHTMPDGRSVAYVTRRMVPQADSYVRAGGVGVTDSDRIDFLAYRYLGHSAGFWQLADANEAMHPLSLTLEAGHRLIIPLPRARGA